MDRPRFVFLILILAVPGVGLAQDQVSTETSSTEILDGRTAPIMRAAEADSSQSTPTNEASGGISSSETASEPILIKGGEKRPRSLMEELFSNPLNYLLILVVFVYVYLMFMQPKGLRKEQRELTEKLKNLKKNDRVVTTSGIHGIVANVNAESNTITLRVDESTNTKLTIDRMSIRSIAS